MSGPQGAAAVRTLAADLARIPLALRTEARREMRAVGESVRQSAAANASWSRQIPAALQLRTAFDGKYAGVTVVASVAKARHARVYEGITRDPFRHPVFGDRETWVAQPARPYLLPAAAAGREDAEVGLVAAVDSVLARHGFGR